MTKPPFKKITILLSLLSVSVLTSAAETTGNLYRFRLGTEIRGLLATSQQDNQFTGNVIYDKGGDGEISLTGQTSPNGHFEWNESLWTRTNQISNKTGSFSGTLTPDQKKGQGQWVSGDGKKQYPLELARQGTFTTLKDPELNADIRYPRFDQPIYQSLNAQLQKVAEGQFAKNRKTVKAFRSELTGVSPETIQHLAASTNCNVEGLSPTAVSILCGNYEFAGGAHGNTDFTALNYTISPAGTATRIGLRELLNLTPGNSQQLASLIIADLKRQQASSVIDGSLTAPLLADSLKKSQIPVTFSPNGITFHFPPYAAGSYAEGYFKVIIPVQKLKSMLRHPWPMNDS